MAEPLVTVAEDHDMYAYFSITETQAISLIQKYGSLENFMHQAPEVELKLGNGTMYEWRGKINAVSGTIDQTTGAVTLPSLPIPPHTIVPAIPSISLIT